MRLGGDVARVEVQAGDGVGALGALGLLLDGDGPALAVELHDAEALGVVHIVAEHGGAILLRHGLPQMGRQPGTVEDIIPQNHGAAVVADKFLAQDERLCQTVRRGLHLVGKADTKLAAVAQQPLKVRQILGRGDDQNIPDTRQHQRRERIINHGLIIDGQELLGCDHRQRIQPRSASSCKNDTFHRWPPCVDVSILKTVLFTLQKYPL